MELFTVSARSLANATRSREESQFWSAGEGINSFPVGYALALRSLTLAGLGFIAISRALPFMRRTHPTPQIMDAITTTRLTAK